MRAEIITVGTELLHGYTIDTHSSYISRECVSLGIQVCRHASVGDDAKELCHLLRCSSSPLVFLCGGLGPTQDDLTKEALSDFLGVPLVMDTTICAELDSTFSVHTYQPSCNLKQALIFEGATVFPNGYGTAPGMAVEKDGVVYILLPGPPRELYAMFENQVTPFLMQRLKREGHVASCSFSFFGLGESFIQDRLEGVMKIQEDQTFGLYASDMEVILRVTVQDSCERRANHRLREIKKQVKSCLGEYCFSEKEEALEEVVISSLQKQHLTVCAVESCTGGRLSSLLSSIPGSSQVFLGGWVCYTNQSKERIAHVPRATLEEYGAISAETAEVLAKNAQEHFDADFSLSITGVIGPAQAEGKPVGLVYIGFSKRDGGVRRYQLQLKGSRDRLQMLVAKYALWILYSGV